MRSNPAQFNPGEFLVADENEPNKSNQLPAACLLSRVALRFAIAYTCREGSDNNNSRSTAGVRISTNYGNTVQGLGEFLRRH